MAGVVALATLAACEQGAAPDPHPLIRIHYSHFSPGEVTVPAGVPVMFTIRNDDPIAHEFIIGTEAEQLRHESGTERTHDGKPGQASLDGGETQTVTFTFAAPGVMLYGCHLPGHYAYGMRGTIRVTS